MNTSRRSFIRISAAAASLGALAGCVDSSDAGDDGDGAADGTDDDGDDSEDSTSSPHLSWLYDPSSLMAVENHGFATFNVDTIYDNREHIPDELFDEIEELDSEFENADMEEFQQLTAQGFGSLETERGGVTIVASGSFDADAIAAELEDAAGDEMEDVVEDSYEGYTLYNVEEEYQTFGMDPDEDDRYISFTTAISAEHLLLSYVLDAELRSDDAVREAIDTNLAGETPYYDNHDSVQSLVDQIDDAMIGFGVELDQTLLEQQYQHADPEAQELLSDLAAFGMSVSLEGETTASRVILVYDAEDLVSRDAAESLIEMLREEPEFDDSVDDIDVQQDGRALVISSSVDAEEFWDDFVGPTTGTDTGVDVDDGNGGFDEHEDTPMPPAVGFDIEYDSASETAVITHIGGDDIEESELFLSGAAEKDEIPGWDETVEVGDSTDEIDISVGQELEIWWEDPETGEQIRLW